MKKSNSSSRLIFSIFDSANNRSLWDYYVPNTPISHITSGLSLFFSFWKSPFRPICSILPLSFNNALIQTCWHFITDSLLINFFISPLYGCRHKYCRSTFKLVFLFFKKIRIKQVKLIHKETSISHKHSFWNYYFILLID